MRTLPEQVVAQLQRLDQLVDLGARVVEAERGPAGGGQAETGHQRLGAVVPGAHRYPLAVDDRRDVARVRAAGEREGEERPLALELTGPTPKRTNCKSAF